MGLGGEEGRGGGDEWREEEILAPQSGSYKKTTWGAGGGMRTLTQSPRVFLLLLLESPCSLVGPFVRHVFTPSDTYYLC